MRSREHMSFTVMALLAIVLRGGAALAIEHRSARISALGGSSVAGVVPDLYTDIAINPAYGFFADRLTVSYAKRWIPGYAPSLPYLEEGSSGYRGYSMNVNELSAWGIRLSSWRAAAFVQWALNRPESATSDPSMEIDVQSYTRLRETWYSYNDDFARIDLLAARALGDRYALGLRLQSWGYNNYDSELSTNAYERYSDPFLISTNRTENTTDICSFLGRRLAFDLQAGIVKIDDTGPRTDLAVAISLNKLDYRKERYRLSINKNYDQAGMLNSYNYQRFHWDDARKGDLWSCALTLRHSFGCGIRVLAGGDVSTSSYKTGWNSSEHLVQWGDWIQINQRVTGAFDGDGSLQRGSCFFKGGRIFSLHRTTDLYLGLHGVFARTSAREEPLVHYSIASEDESPVLGYDHRTLLESTETSFDLLIPLSVEFRPSGYFSYFASFILTGTWQKDVTTKSMLSPFSFFGPADALANADALAPAGARLSSAASQEYVDPAEPSTDWERHLSTGSATTLGFSFHYRDRYFMDVYTQSAIIPNNIASCTIDVRYAF